MHKRTKASQIPKKVKEIVYKRDGERCLICGRWVPPECACAHFVSRARLGLGIEQNILTLCHECHYALDNGEVGRNQLREYLESKYPGWTEKEVIYNKWTN